MSCFICKRKKKPAPEPGRAPPRAAREPPKAAPEPRRPPPPQHEEIGPSKGRNQWGDGEMDRMRGGGGGLTRNTEMPSYAYWNNNRDDDDLHNFVDKIFKEDPKPRMPKPIPRSQFQQDYGLPETLMSSAETYYDYGCVGAPSSEPPPYPYGSD